jgi:predicted ABC-type ATPase
MFAGPNGSGKSTIKERVGKRFPRIFGIYVNPDEIGKQILQSSGRLNFRKFRIKVTADEVFASLRASGFLAKHKLLDEIDELRYFSNSLFFPETSLVPYFISPIADFLHEKLIEVHKTFTLETVMSHPQKIKLLERAREAGFRTYLYYVATENPEINLTRVKERVSGGGHGVSAERVTGRYPKSLDNLLQAISVSDRAYMFDNSGNDSIWFAEITDGDLVEFKGTNVPRWFEKYVLEKVHAEPV